MSAVYFARAAWRVPLVAALVCFVCSSPAGAQAEAGPSPDDTAAPPREAATVMSEVKVVEGEATETTEGSGSYTSPRLSLGKSSQSIKDTPQSVTVITRQRLDDQNIVSIPDAMKYATGVTVQRFDGAGMFNTYNVRGFTVDTIQLDGLAFGSSGNVTELDAAVYDRIEILRGPAGLFQGAGEPAAVINLARKRALPYWQTSGALTAGSWDAYRGEVDATGPLNADGSLRARGVVAYDDRDSYVDVLEAKRKIAYGTLEYDFTPATTLSLGGARQEIDTAIDQGLPAYADGRLLDVPVSTFIGADWNQLLIDTTDLFAELEHRFDGGGRIKAALRQLDRTMLYRVARANSAVDANGDVAMQTGLYTWDRENSSADVYLDLPFNVLGRTHNFVFGADWREQEELVHSTPFVNTTTMDVFEPNHALPQPDFSFNSRTDSTVEQYGVYSQLRYALLDSLTAVGGARATWWETVAHNQLTGAVTSEYDVEGEVTPYAALLYELVPQVSLYASYAEIFVPQSARTPDNQQIEPRIGGQVEAGIKGELLQGQLNAQFAVFRLEDENRAIATADPLYFVPSGKVRSQGFETELSGQLLRGWDMTLGYTYVDTTFVDAPPAQVGQVFSTFTPRHSASLWTQYLFSQGALDGLSVGGGVRSVSEFYSQSNTVRFVADAYTVLAAKLGYRLNEHWSANLVVNNLLDEKYYEKISSFGRQNFYGAPRSVNLALRASF